MKKVKQGFLNWTFSLVDETKQIVVILSVEILNKEGHESYTLSIRSNKEGLDRVLEQSSGQADKESITIGESSFSKQGIHLELEEAGWHLRGEIGFEEQVETQQSKWRPGIMGPYRFLPFLQSYHEVISLRHRLTGYLQFNGEKISFNEGRGYSEKEWGRKSPRIWIKAQCSHFKGHDMALMVGVARIPFLLEYYTSFAVPLYYKGHLEVFASYNGGQIAKLYRYKGYVHLIITQKSEILDLKIYGSDETPLIMDRRSHRIKDIYECLTAKVEVRLIQSGHVILEDVGNCCHLEMGGNTSKLK